MKDSRGVDYNTSVAHFSLTSGEVFQVLIVLEDGSVDWNESASYAAMQEYIAANGGE